MAKKDYYGILGINKNASQDEIKKAFRNLAKKYHPDINKEKDAEAKFKEANEAFQVLSDQQKRNQYDQFGHADFNGQDFSRSYSSGQGFNFEDIFKGFGFDDLFGGFNRREREEERSFRVDLEINLEDAFNGLKKNIDVPLSIKCENCKGTGAKPGFLKECSGCQGTGEARNIRRTPFGQIVTVSTCDDCGGTGKIISKPCEKCDGEGRIKKNKKVEADIPKGVDNEQYLRINIEDSILYVFVFIKKHDIFERDNNDLFCKTTIDLGTAILGGEVEIPTINGKAKLKIPSGTQSPTVFRLKGQGMHELNSNRRGDQLVKVVVEIPEKLNKKQESLIREAFSDKKEAETKKGFFEKLREAF